MPTVGSDARRFPRRLLAGTETPMPMSECPIQRNAVSTKRGMRHEETICPCGAFLEISFI